MTNNWYGSYTLLLANVYVWLAGSQNTVLHPSLPVELGKTVKLREISENYYVISHERARLPEQTPRIDQKEMYSQILATEKAQQQKELKGHYMLQEKYYPQRSLLKKNEYYFDSEPKDYSIGLLVDPCKGKRHDCCMMKYGTPEYRLSQNTSAEATGEELIAQYSNLYDEHGQPLQQEESRIADDELKLNESCLGAGKPYATCLSISLQAAKPHLKSRKEGSVWSTKPNCWDHNTTVISGVNCTDPHGQIRPACVQVAFSYSAYLPICSGDFADDNHCGVYLEIHETPVSTFQAAAVHVKENYMVLPIVCPGANCKEKFKPGTRFEVRENESPTSQVIFGPVSVKSVHEKDFDDKPCNTDDASSECTSTWVYWSEAITGPGYRECSLIYARDVQRYDDKNQESFVCTSDTINPTFIRGESASVFTIAGDETVLADTKIVNEKVSGYNTTTISTYYQESLQILNDDIAKRKILCARDYQLWFVYRTKYNFMVQKRKSFTVSSPKCTFDKVNDVFLPFAFLGDVGLVKQEEYVIKDIFVSNDRQWHHKAHFLNATGALVYPKENYSDYTTGDQHKNYRNDYFFDH